MITKKPILMIALAAVVAVGGFALALNNSPANAGKSLMLGLGNKAPVSKPVNYAPDAKATKAGMAMLEELDSTFAGISEQASLGVVSIQSGQGASGSGFVYRTDGWIVTNDHVVGNSSSVQVALPDGRTVPGKVIKSGDAQIDLAVVKIDANGLTALPLANSNLVRVGQFTIAVGSPFGLDDTVTVGHVSALGRGSTVNDPNSMTARGYSGLIQTDASINPGNSGGPLLNIHGEVIGVNSTIVSTTAASAGIGFSIPSNVVRAVADELIETGKFDRGVLGAFIRELKPIEKTEFKAPGGAMIDDVVAGTPAAEAGLVAKDVIVSLDGKEVPTELALRIKLYEASPGQSVQVGYIRDGVRKQTSLKLAEPEQPQQLGMMGQPGQGNMQEFPFDRLFGDQGQAPQMPDGPVRLGLGVREVDATLRSQFKLPAESKGVVVMSIDENSFGAQVGAKQGDLLVELNGEAVTKVGDLRMILEDVNWGDRVTVVLERFEDGKMSRLTQTRRIR